MLKTMAQVAGALVIVMTITVVVGRTFGLASAYDMLAYTAPHPQRRDPEILLIDVWHKLAINIWDYAGTDSHQAWSADGRLLAFNTGPKFFAGVHVFDLETGLVTPLFESDDILYPVPSPDFLRVAYIRLPQTLAVYDRATATERMLVSNFEQGVTPKWSHDGYALLPVFIRDSDSKMYRLDVFTGEQIPLFNSVPQVTDAIWSPDATEVVVLSRDGAFTDFYYIDSQGTRSLLIDNWESIRHITWSPDGTQLAFIS